MREIATGWVEAFPNRADAHETLALGLETLGELTVGRFKDYSAMSEIRRARGLADDRSTALRLANAETRFLVKLEKMAEARALADSLLEANPEPSLDDARRLRGLAALTGRVHLAARLQRRAAPEFTFLTPDWEEVDVPLPLTDAALGLFAYSSFGVPQDSLTALETRIERLIPSYVEASKRSRVRQALLVTPSALAYPELGLRPMHSLRPDGDYRLEIQLRLAQRNLPAVRQLFEKLSETRRNTRPGDVAFDGTYHEAWILLQIGDTAGATRLLDLSLEALPALGTYLLDQVPQVATLVRGMALRAELAKSMGDRSTAARWAGNVVALWSQSDAELIPTVKRMQELSTDPTN
jgi:tetratricopeptide (TPR) repeat protein